MMDKMEIRIAVGAFCPQFTLPCIGSVAYPDPTSCKHYYFCSDHGEVRRFSCEDSFTDSRVKIAKGAALCVPSSKSTCHDDNPAKQCAAVANFLPQEYCEVEVPSGSSWVYPDPVDCSGYYKYTPTTSLPPEGRGVVVEHRVCPRPLIYSPDSRECVARTRQNDNLCGGKWIHNHKECSPTTSRDKLSGKEGTSTRKHQLTTLSSQTSSNTTLTGVISTHQSVPIVPVLIALASTIAILTLCATFCFVMYHRRQKTRQQRQLSSMSHEIEDGGVDAIQPPGIAEQNEYAAIEEVFRDTIERQRLFPSNGRCVPPELPARNVDPDTNLTAAVSTTLPRPHSQPVCPVTPIRRSKPHNVTDRPTVAPTARESFGLFQKDEFKEPIKTKQSIDMTWLQALNSSLPVDSESSDEYEAVEIPPNFQPGNTFKVESLKPSESLFSDTEEYMVPIVGTSKLYSTVQKNTIDNNKNETQVIPKRRSTIEINSVSDEAVFSNQTGSLGANDDHSSAVSQQSSATDLLSVLDLQTILSLDNRSEECIAFTPSDNTLEKANLYRLNPDTLSGKSSPRESWEVSASWVRIRSPDISHKPLSHIIFPPINNEETTPVSSSVNPPLTYPVLSFPPEDIETILEKDDDLENKLDNKTLTDTDVTTDVTDIVHLDQLTFSDVRGPAEIGSSVLNVNDVEDCCDVDPISSDSPVTSEEDVVNITHVNPVLDVSVSMVSSSPESAEAVTSPGPRGRLGYEIVVSTDCDADFRVYQCISGESADSSDSDDREYPIPPNDSTAETVCEESKTKHHEYYILDKHNSDDTFESTKPSETPAIGTIKLNYRQSCRF